MSTSTDSHGDTPPQIMKQHLATPVSLSPSSLPEGERDDDGSLCEPHVNTALARQLRGSLLIAAALYFVDAIWLGQGAIAVFTLLILFFIVLPRTLWAWKNKPLRNLRAAKLLVYLMMAIAIGTTIRIDLNQAKRHAETLIVALKQYQARHGSYPEQLEQLVPEFLPTIPQARFCLTANTFFYRAADNSHTLSYMVMPPFGWESHNLETGRWTIRD